MACIGVQPHQVRRGEIALWMPAGLSHHPPGRAPCRLVGASNLGPVRLPEIVPDSKNNFSFERPQSWNGFWRFWGLCGAEQPQISANNPAAGRSAYKLRCGARKTIVWPQALSGAVAATLQCHWE